MPSCALPLALALAANSCRVLGVAPAPCDNAADHCAAGEACGADGFCVPGGADGKEGEGEGDAGEGEGEGDAGEGEGEGEGDAGDPCGNGVVDVDEECDGGFGCELDCKFDPRRRCVGVDCWLTFDGRAPAHVEELVADGVAPVDVVGTGACADVDTSQNGLDTIDLCGTAVPVSYVQQPDGSVLFVMSMRTLSLADAALRIEGTRPAVLLVFGDARLAGATIDVGARGEVAGPGGSARSRVLPHCGLNRGGGDAINNTFGGGGGGWFSAGGNGGIGGDAAGFADNGGSPALDIDVRDGPLVGGCHGGIGGDGSEAVDPGGGGGAFQLSVAGSLDLAGATFLAGGGGGNGSASEGGAGGGAGGSLLLEARNLDNEDTAVFGIRGGGGGGGGSEGSAGQDGFDGEAEENPLDNGDGGPAFPGGDGGDCCDFDNLGDGFDGDDGTDGGDAGGGGAGGLGVVETYDDL